MSKFKVGDLVVVFEADEDWYAWTWGMDKTVGGKFRIKDIKESSDIDLDNGYTYPPHCLRKVKGEEKVMRKDLGSVSINQVILNVFGNMKEAKLINKHFREEIENTFTGEVILKANKEAYLVEAKKREKEEKDNSK